MSAPAVYGGEGDARVPSVERDLRESESARVRACTFERKRERRRGLKKEKKKREHFLPKLQGVAGCCRVLQGVAGCSIVLQGVAGCCRVLLGIAVCVPATCGGRRYKYPWLPRTAFVKSRSE